MSAENGQGFVVAVCMSPNHAYPTFARKRIEIGPMGIPGDAHSGPTRESFTKPGTVKPNDRPISIVPGETYTLLSERFGIDRKPGDFNEQVLVEGAGYLDDVAVDDEVHFEGGVQIGIVDHAYPCQKLVRYLELPSLREVNDLLVEEVNGERRSKRGLLGQVLKAGIVEPGEQLTIVRKTLFQA